MSAEPRQIEEGDKTSDVKIYLEERETDKGEVENATDQVEN